MPSDEYDYQTKEEVHGARRNPAPPDGWEVAPGKEGAWFPFHKERRTITFRRLIVKRGATP